MTARPQRLSAALLLLTVAAGAGVRFSRAGLPGVVVKYGGSMLWALAIYWVVSTVLPRVRVAAGAGIAGTIATAVEFFKLYRSPGVDAFRATLPGILLLGRYFSVWDLVAYWVAICAGAWLDVRIRRAGECREAKVV